MKRWPKRSTCPSRPGSRNPLARRRLSLFPGGGGQPWPILVQRRQPGFRRARRQEDVLILDQRAAQLHLEQARFHDQGDPVAIAIQCQIPRPHPLRRLLGADRRIAQIGEHAHPAETKARVTHDIAQHRQIAVDIGELLNGDAIDPQNLDPVVADDLVQAWLGRHDHALCIRRRWCHRCHSPSPTSCWARGLPC